MREPPTTEHLEKAAEPTQNKSIKTQPSTKAPPPPIQKIDLKAVAAERESLQPDPTELAIAEELAEDRRWLSSSVPRKIHFAAAHCYHGQGEGKEKVKITYDLHVVDSEVSLKNIEFVEDPLNDAQFRGCVRTAMENFTTPAKVADTVESEEMNLSIRGLKKILRQQATDRE